MEKIKSNYNENILNDKYNELKNNPDFITLINKFKISETEIKNNLSSLEDTLNELHNCKKCPGLSECKNRIKGYVYYPENKESFLCFGYAKCKKLKEYEKHRPKNMLFQPIAVVTSALSGFFNFIVKNFESVVVQRLI